MKALFIGVLFILWMIITTVFVFSIVGLFMVLKSNETGYHKYGKEVRTNWMQIGFDLLEELKKS